MVTYATPTTALIITKPSNFHRLETRYRLVRYELPETLLRVAKKNSNAYVLMHNCVREQLDHPYKMYRHDRVDGVEKWVIYALYPRYAVPTNILLSLFAGDPLPAREITFDQLDLWPLLMLLQVAYCHCGQIGRFVGQDMCYVYGKKERNYTHLCLQVDIERDGETSPEEGEQVFRLVSRVRRFQRVTGFRKQLSSYTYFAFNDSSGRCSLSPVKSSEVSAYRQRRQQIYKLCFYEGRLAALLAQDQQSLDGYIGKLLYDFIHDFLMELVSYGIVGRSKKRYFRKFADELMPSEQARLRIPLTVPDSLAIFDHRLNREYPLQRYLDRLAYCAPTFHFKTVADLAEMKRGAVLVIQDYEQEDFELNGALIGLVDAPTDLYKKCPHVMWQALNVNPNSLIENGGVNDYLKYAPSAMGDKKFQEKVNVALAQLYLKGVISYQRCVSQRLPPLPAGYAFIRKKHAYETLLFVENDVLRFLDLRDPARQSQRDALLERWGVNWEAMYAVMCQKYRARKRLDETQEPSQYDVIVGQDLFIEVRNLDERVLYNYGEIIRRQASMDVALPTEEFKLLPHYDDICPGMYLPSSTIMQRGLLAAHAQLKSKREVTSLKFYHQLKAYDAFLDEVKRSDPFISFNQLTSGAYWEEIIRIFDIQPGKSSHSTRNQFKGYYQKRGWFSNQKGKALPLYEGVWYDDTHSYIVGPEQPQHQQQLHAHPIRQFDVYQGEDHFDCSPLLLATCVQYAGQQQHSLYPYAFHLIDLFVDWRLRPGCDHSL